MLDFIKEILGFKKPYPSYTGYLVKDAINHLIIDFYENANNIFTKHPQLGVIHAIGPGYKKHVRNHILASIDPSLYKTAELTSGSAVFPGYNGTNLIDEGITEALLPYTAYFALNSKKYQEGFDNFGILVDSIVNRQGINKNPLAKEHAILTELPINEKDIHLSTFNVVSKSLNFKTISTPKIKIHDFAELPKLFNKDVLLSLYLKAKVTKNSKDLERFTKMFNLDKDNFLFPAVLAYDLGVVSKENMKQFLTHHYQQCKLMKYDVFNRIAPLLILNKITKLEDFK